MIDYDALIKELLPTIRMLAWQTYPKIKKPSCLDVEDLIQEGTIVCWEWVSRWYKPDRKASVKTFAITGIKCHFSDLIKKSWRSVDVQPESPANSEENGSETTIIEQIIGKQYTDASSLLMALSHFTAVEKVYISKVLFPPNHIKAHITTKPRQFRMCIRKNLSLTIEEENQIRKTIEKKLNQLNTRT